MVCVFLVLFFRNIFSRTIRVGQFTPFSGTAIIFNNCHYVHGIVTYYNIWPNNPWKGPGGFKSHDIIEVS